MRSLARCALANVTWWVAGMPGLRWLERLGIWTQDSRGEFEAQGRKRLP